MAADLETLTEAELYDRVWTRAPEVEWFARSLSPDDGPVLEAGVGTGRIAIPMAQAGFTVVGQDLSEERLRVLEKKAASLPPGTRDRLTVRLGDMVDDFPQGEYAAVLFPFNMVAEFQSDRLTALLAKVRSSLLPGGRLFSIQMLPKPIVLAIGSGQFTCEGKAWPDGTRLLYQASSLHLPPLAGSPDREMRHWLSYKALRGNVVAREWIYSDVQWFRPPEVFEAMLTAAGFAAVEHWADGTGTTGYAEGAPMSAVLAVSSSNS